MDEITIKEAAAVTGLSERMVRYHAGKGHLPSRRLGKRLLLIPRRDARNFTPFPSGPRPKRRKNLGK